MKQTLCWTCAHAGKCKKPILGWDAKLHYIKYNKHYANHVDASPEYEYDGECVYCAFNTKHERKRLYESCPHFIRNCIGCCAQENYMRGNYDLEGDNIG